MHGIIKQGDYVVVKKYGGEHIRVLRFTPKQKVLVEKLKFEADSTIGHPFGIFEVASGKARPISVDQLQVNDEAEEPEMVVESTEKQPMGGCGDTETTEESTPTVTIEEDGRDPAQALQKLTQDEVLDLKSKGISASDLVSKLVEGNKSFANRTAFSQSKYIRRKAKKHSDKVLILKPTIRMLVQSYYLKDADRLSNLRPDMLGLILQMAGIHFGKRVVVFDQLMGAVTSAIVERLGGEGACVHLHRGIIAQSLPLLHSMNYDETTLSTFLPMRIAYFLADGNLIEEEKHPKPEDNGTSAEPMETEVKDVFARRLDRLAREKRGMQLIKENLVDSLIIATRTVEPISVLETLYSRIRNGATVVVYGPNMGPVIEAQRWLMSNGAANVQLSDHMFRIHQVLPDRTHPLMSQSVVGGITLSAIKVASH